MPWSDLDLTDAEVKAATDAALDKYRMEKYHRQQSEKRQKERDAFRNNLTRDWTADELVNYLMTLNQARFLIDERNRELVLLLAQYFTGDPAFERHGYHLQKGLLLMGNVGVGKTDLMRFFKVNKRMSYAIRSCSAISGDYAANGSEVLNSYQQNVPQGEGDYRIFYQRETGWCFDDLGVEEDRKNFGNQLNVMANILLERYEERHRFPFFSMHMTTNLSIDDIGERYGDRVASRIPEMFNLIVLEGEDRRLKK